MVEITTIFLGAASTASCAGVIYAIVRNGSRGKKQDAELKAQLKIDVAAITKQLNDPDTGLAVIAKAATDMKVHCAESMSAVINQQNTNSNEIAMLREKKRTRKKKS